ncbi:DNA polymerase III, alpha subunit, partial [human gut metagenome]
EVSMEMYQRGYRFINVDIQHSEARRFSIKDGALLPPFLAIDSLVSKTYPKYIVANYIKISTISTFGI